MRGTETAGESGATLPLAWQVVPRQDGPWAERQTTSRAALMRTVATALPPDCTVMVLGEPPC